ncbi:MAG: trypsin-like peptidase domain-containing protein [Actinomycetota bacterium]|nr:trypsin-like peptidase domain-containing protein [Actinomycetota bacterium]
MNTRIPTIAAAVTLAAGLGAGVGGTIVALADEDPDPVAASADTATPVAEAPSSTAALYKRVAGGVVQIRAQSGPGAATGSGFVIDEEGHVVTNQHVVDDAERVTVVFADGDERRGRVVGTDPSTDIAVVDVEAPASELQPLRFGSETSLEVGDPLIAIGSPFGLRGTLTTGVVSALDREIRAPNGFTIQDAIQTDAALNNGNSGGPVLDSAGRVVGVAAQIRSESGGNDGVGYAIPAGKTQDVARELIEDGEVEHAYLGVSLSGEGEARVMEVVPGSPAARAGIRANDLVTEVDGRRVTSGDQLRAAIDAKRPGEELRLTIRRAGNERELTVELGERPASAQ